jgi:transposase-like protein
MQRKSFSAEFKSKVALEAIKEQTTINEIATKYQVFPPDFRTRLKKLGLNPSFFLKNFFVLVL